VVDGGHQIGEEGELLLCLCISFDFVYNLERQKNPRLRGQPNLAEETVKELPVSSVQLIRRPLANQIDSLL